MQMQVDFWNLVSLALGIVAAFGTVGKLLLTQIDKQLDQRFTDQAAAREAGAKALRDTIDRYMTQSETTQGQLKQLERDFLDWKANLPMLYVLRDDYVRNMSTIELKIDGLRLQIENAMLRRGQE